MTRLAIAETFDISVTCLDAEAQARLDGLVRLDTCVTRLAKIPGLLNNPAGLQAWASRCHLGANGLVDLMLKRPPPIVLASSDGSGKLEVVKTNGDGVVRRGDFDIPMCPMDPSARGRRRVGQMTELLSAVFVHILKCAQKLDRQNMIPTKPFHEVHNK